MKGILLVLLLGLIGATVVTVVRLFQRELSKLQALTLKGEELRGQAMSE